MKIEHVTVSYTGPWAAGDLGTYERIILKWTLKKQVWMIWNGSILLRIDSNGRLM
jgi:hypothetical protein